MLTSQKPAIDLKVANEIARPFRSRSGDGFVKGGRPPSARLCPSTVLDLMRCADLLAVATGALLAYAAYAWNIALGSEHVVAIGAALFLSAIAFGASRAYDLEFLEAEWRVVGRLLVAWLCVLGVLLLLAFMLKISVLYSRFWVLCWLALTPCLIILERLLFLSWVQVLATESRLAVRTVIVGTNRHGQRVAQRIERSHDLRVRLIGFVDEHEGHFARSMCGYPVLGGLDQLLALVRMHGVDRVVVALPWVEPKRVHELIWRLAPTRASVVLAPDLAGLTQAGSFVRVAGMPMLQIFDRTTSGGKWIVKVVEDRLGSALLLVLTVPVLAIIALAIKLDSPGPILFWQKRCGFNGRTIEICKFRTMSHSHPDAAGAPQTCRDDPRVTRTGRFLRSWSLDELPQLVNVLKGQMSLVGPRPHALLTTAIGRPLEEVVYQYAARHRVKPGMTGWAQINGWRGTMDTVEQIEKRVEHDLYYIENFSIRFDLAILIGTISAMFRRSNSY